MIGLQEPVQVEPLLSWPMFLGGLLILLGIVFILSLILDEGSED